MSGSKSVIKENKIRRSYKESYGLTLEKFWEEHPETTENSLYDYLFSFVAKKYDRETRERQNIKVDAYYYKKEDYFSVRLILGNPVDGEYHIDDIISISLNAAVAGANFYDRDSHKYCILHGFLMLMCLLGEFMWTQN